MQSFGYEIFYPEMQTVEEQIYKFSSATHIAGENGSGLHSTIFSLSGAIVTCLRSGLRSVGSLQAPLVCASSQKRVMYLV